MAVDKLVDSTQLNADLTSVANAIRTKGGTSASLAFPAGFVSAIGDIPTGGGGASNVVTGTFTGTTTGAAMDVPLDYSGNGYPIAVMVYPEEGPYNSSGTFYSLIQRYAIQMFSAIKIIPGTDPIYGNNAPENQCTTNVSYKNSSGSADSYAVSTLKNSRLYQNAAATSYVTTTLRFKSSTKMSVYIASTSYGFAANITYRYWVIYSE